MNDLFDGAAANGIKPSSVAVGDWRQVELTGRWQRCDGVTKFADSITAGIEAGNPSFGIGKGGKDGMPAPQKIATLRRARPGRSGSPVTCFAGWSGWLTFFA
jgi:hypothetical protein